jgi:ribosome-binding protein aMBF1 (putative translation factor)
MSKKGNKMECERCNIDSNEVRLFDAIWNGQMTNLCERCSIIENIPIIKAPKADQLKESEKTEKVYPLMKRLSGVKSFEKDETYFQEDKLNELDSHPELELPERDKLNLIQYFHWEVMRSRRRKGMSQQQLSAAIGESEVGIQMIEKAKLPENAENLIKKLEQFLQIKLREFSKAETLMKDTKKDEEPILLDEKGHEIDIIPEEKPIIIDEEPEENVERLQETSSEINDILKKMGCRVEPFEEDKQKMICQKEPNATEIPLRENPAIEYNPTKEIPRTTNKGDLDLRRTNSERVTIGELKKMHEVKVEEIKKEEDEEQKKLEERRKILEELRRKDNQRIEEKRKQEILERQKREQQQREIIEQKRREMEKVNKEEFKDINQHLGGMELIDKNKKPSPEYRNSIKEFDDELI